MADQKDFIINVLGNLKGVEGLSKALKSLDRSLDSLDKKKFTNISNALVGLTSKLSKNNFSNNVEKTVANVEALAKAYNKLAAATKRIGTVNVGTAPVVGRASTASNYFMQNLEVTPTPTVSKSTKNSLVSQVLSSTDLTNIARANKNLETAVKNNANTANQSLTEGVRSVELQKKINDWHSKRLADESQFFTNRALRRKEETAANFRIYEETKKQTKLSELISTLQNQSVLAKKVQLQKEQESLKNQVILNQTQKEQDVSQFRNITASLTKASVQAKQKSLTQEIKEIADVDRINKQIRYYKGVQLQKEQEKLAMLVGSKEFTDITSPLTKAAIGYKNQELNKNRAVLGGLSDKEFLALAKAEDKAANSANNLSDATNKSKKAINDKSNTIDKATKSTKSYSDEILRVTKHALIVVPVWTAFRTVVTALTTTFRDGIQYVYDFDKALTKSAQFLEGGLSNKAQIGQLTKEFKELSIQTGKPFEDLQQGFQSFATFGQDFETSIAGMRTAAKASTVTFEELKDISELLAQSYILMGDSIKEGNTPQEKMNITMAKVFGLMKENSFTLAEFRQSFQYFVSAASAANFTLDETNALLATMNSAGLKASKAGTALRSSFANLLGNLPKVAEELDLIVNLNRDNQFQVLIQVLERMRTILETDSAEKYNKSLKEVFGGSVRGAEGIRALTNTLERLRSNMKIASGDSAGLTEELKKLYEGASNSEGISQDKIKQAWRGVGSAVVTGITDGMGGGLFKAILKKILITDSQSDLEKQMKALGTKAGMIFTVALSTVLVAMLAGAIKTGVAIAMTEGVLAGIASAPLAAIAVPVAFTVAVGGISIALWNFLSSDKTFKKIVEVEFVNKDTKNFMSGIVDMGRLFSAEAAQFTLPFFLGGKNKAKQAQALKEIVKSDIRSSIPGVDTVEKNPFDLSGYKKTPLPIGLGIDESFKFSVQTMKTLQQLTVEYEKQNTEENIKLKNWERFNKELEKNKKGLSSFGEELTAIFDKSYARNLEVLRAQNELTYSVKEEVKALNEKIKITNESGGLNGEILPLIKEQQILTALMTKDYTGIKGLLDNNIISQETLLELDKKQLEIVKAKQQAYIETAKEVKGISDSLKGSLQGGFSNILQGKGTFKDMFKGFSEEYNKQTSDAFSEGLFDAIGNTGIFDQMGLNIAGIKDTFKAPMERHVDDLRLVFSQHVASLDNVINGGGGTITVTGANGSSTISNVGLLASGIVASSGGGFSGVSSTSGAGRGGFSSIGSLVGNIARKNKPRYTTVKNADGSISRMAVGGRVQGQVNSNFFDSLAKKFKQNNDYYQYVGKGGNLANVNGKMVPVQPGTGTYRVNPNYSYVGEGGNFANVGGKIVPVQPGTGTYAQSKWSTTKSAMLSGAIAGAVAGAAEGGFGGAISGAIGGAIQAIPVVGAVAQVAAALNQTDDEYKGAYISDDGRSYGSDRNRSVQVMGIQLAPEVRKGFTKQEQFKYMVGYYSDPLGLTKRWWGPDRTRIEEGDTYTKQIAAATQVTNNKLDIVNRNLVAMKSAIETYILPTSAYYSEKRNLESQFAIDSARGFT